MDSNYDSQKIINVELSREMKKSYIDYAMSVIVGRALPDVRDGFKPVHRRILYTMHEAGFTPDKAYRKCATTVGDVLGKYHPHGDASVYDALVRMAQDFSLRYPLVDGHGNFGSVDGDPPAAYRYTEARMAKLAVHMISDIDKETVDFQPNYDDRLKEPVVLPSRFPNLLVNGSSGIAVGMATNMPPHNLTEVINGIIATIDNPAIELEELMEFVKGPDFPTAGIIMGRAGIKRAYETGRGKIIIRAKCEIVEENNRTRIIVTELPYQVNKAHLIEKIAELVKDKRIEGIADVNDESDREGMRMVIDLKRDAIPNIVLNKLFKLTQMQDSFGIINLALVDNQPKVLSLREMLHCYIEFQKDVVLRRTKYDKAKAEARAHILEGLRIALDHIDEIIATIRASYDNAKPQLMEKFGLSELQAQAILDMQLKRLQGLEREKIDNEFNTLMALIEKLNAILNDEKLLLNTIKDELIEIREKFGDERRTTIEHDVSDIEDEDLIPDEECVITFTHYGYIKRTSADTYKAQNRGGRGISGLQTREEDFVEKMFIGNSKSNVLLFTNLGRMYRIKAYQIPESGRNAKGIAIVNLLQLQEGEKVNALLPVKSFEEDKYLIMLTKNGVIKRSHISVYNTSRKAGINAIELDEGDSLVSVKVTDGKQDIMIATHNGYSIRFDENGVRATGRTSRGVRAMTLREGDYVIGLNIVRSDEELQFLTITENGYGKRTGVDAYRKQSRGGKGIKTYKPSDKTGLITAIKIVDDDDDIMLITSEGVIIRIHCADISTVGRVAMGVRLVRLGDDVSVIGVGRIERDDEAEVEEIADAIVDTEA
ncbi:MAG: DNA gyrase subunit A [Clostridiales bacterium]|jgi:DNA gyrase subunit A|nr:DNA gyrase subunit A [Clostridiales bacterium]